MTQALASSNGQKGRNYWDMIKGHYPHQIEVPYFSVHDMDPRLVGKRITYEFKRVTFDGITHFGFRHAEHLAMFKKAVGL